MVPVEGPAITDYPACVIRIVTANATTISTMPGIMRIAYRFKRAFAG